MGRNDLGLLPRSGEQDLPDHRVLRPGTSFPRRLGKILPGDGVSQGTRVGRAGTIEITADEDGTVWVGGAATSCIRGTITL